MDILKVDKAPFVLVLLLSLIGWHVAQLIGEVRSNQNHVSYSINQRGSDFSVEVRNESHEKSIRHAAFAVICLESTDCLVAQRGEAGQPFYGYLMGLPPAGGRFLTMGTDSNSIYATVTLPPGGQIRMWGQLKDAGRHVGFFFLPDADQPQDIYVYDRNTAAGFFAENFVAILAVSLGLCVLGLAAFLARSGVLRRKPPPPEDAG